MVHSIWCYVILIGVSLFTLGCLSAFPRRMRAVKMVVGVILAVVLVTSAGLLLFNLQNKAVLARQQIRDTYEMLRTTQRLAADVACAEAAQRDTMLVASPTLIAAFDRAAVQADGDARSLSTMAAANPKLGTTVLRLVGVVGLELAHLRETIASPQGSAPLALRHAILQPALSAEIESITAELRQRAQAEVTLLVEKDKRSISGSAPAPCFCSSARFS